MTESLDAHRPPGLLGASLLVIDDDVELRDRLTGELKQLGYQALTAPDVAAARRVLLSERIDGVVLDLQLAEEDADMEFLRWIRQARPEIPVTVLSTLGTEPGHIAQAYEAGAAAYFEKGSLNSEHLYSDIAARLQEGGRAKLDVT